jgi:hypothetical protein
VQHTLCGVRFLPKLGRGLAHGLFFGSKTLFLRAVARSSIVVQTHKWRQIATFERLASPPHKL